MSTAGGTPPVVRHLVLCKHVEYDFDDPSAPYSLRNIITALYPANGRSYPLAQESLWVYAQASGDPGDYEIWLDLIPLDEEGDDAADGITFGPWVLRVHDGVFVESRAWVLRNVPFPIAGLYEFRLRHGPEVLASEQLLLVEA